MSKKQNKSVDNVEEKVDFCKDCRFRNSGAIAREKGINGSCDKVQKFVSRKSPVCENFKRK